MNLLSIDPGKGIRTGHAVFEDGILFQAGNGLPCPEEGFYKKIDLVVIERPQWRGIGSKENIADLLVLAELVGEYAQLFRSSGIEVERVWPSTWKGSVPKDIHQKRILAKLSPDEIEVIPKRPRAKDHDHNILDAVGVGLWKLRRL